LQKIIESTRGNAMEEYYSDHIIVQPSGLDFWEASFKDIPQVSGWGDTPNLAIADLIETLDEVVRVYGELRGNYEAEKFKEK
jgi:hypothetical protein